METHSGKELRHFKFLCVSFMAQLLGSRSFIQKVGRKNPPPQTGKSAFLKLPFCFQVSEESDNSKDSLQQLQQTWVPLGNNGGEHQ